MGLRAAIAGLLTRRAKTTPADPTESHFPYWWKPQSGVYIDHDIAMTYSAFWACVRVISETLASMPWNVYEHVGEWGRKKRTDHTVDRLLNYRPNSEMSPFDFKQTLVAHALTWGNGYAEIERSNGQIGALWPLAPDRVEPDRDEIGRLVYKVRNWDQREDVVLPASSILHLKGLGYDGLKGYSVVSVAAESIGLGIAAERFGAAFFGNGARPGGVIEFPGAFKDEAAHKRMRDSWLEAHKGVSNAHTPAILEQGATYKPMSIPPEDAQFLETRKDAVVVMCRVFRVQPHKVADLERATFSNIEHLAIEFVTDTCLPWAVRIEQEGNIKLLPQQMGSRGLYIRVNLNSLLRGDIKSRYEAYAIGRDRGWLSGNDIRRLEDMNPLPAEYGDLVLVQGQYVPLDSLAAKPEELQQPEKPAAKPKPPDAAPMRGMLAAAIGSLVRREISKANAAIERKDIRDYDKWAGRFYRHYVDTWNADLLPVVRSLADLAQTNGNSQTVRDASERIARDWIMQRCVSACDELRQSENRVETLGHWKAQRAETDTTNLMDQLQLVLCAHAGSR